MNARTVTLAVVLLACFASLLAGGCVSSDTPTRGWAFEADVNDPRTNRAVRFEVKRDGSLVYFAGIGALPGSAASAPTWTGPCTGEELAGAIDIVSDPNIERVEPEPAKTRYRLHAAPAGGGGRTLDSGPTPALERLISLLDRLQRSKRASEFEPGFRR